jgi:hypothetical protein
LIEVDSLVESLLHWGDFERLIAFSKIDLEFLSYSTIHFVTPLRYSSHRAITRIGGKMETLDTLVTYAYDLTLGGGAFYIGTSLIVYLVDRWRELDGKPKPKPQAVNIPLELKAAAAEALPLAEVQATRSLEALPLPPDPVEPLTMQPPLQLPDAELAE